MAYKNKKKNENLIHKLNKDFQNWRNVKRRLVIISQARIEMRQCGMDESKIESFLVQKGLIKDHERQDY